MEEHGVIIISDRSNLDATAGDKLILTIVIHSPKGRYAPGDTIVIVNTANQQGE